MANAKIIEVVTTEYLKLYKSWTDVEITEWCYCDDGFFLVVCGKEKDKWREGEICFCSKSMKVTIFSTTEELLRQLDRKLNPEAPKLLFTKMGLSILIILLSLVTLCVLVFLPSKPNDQIVQLIGGALLAAVGFLFGSSK